MGWHDAVLYTMSFPQANYAVRFDIDYIFEWHWEREAVRGWDVAPCTLEFNSVSDLKVSLDWQIHGDTSIQDITCTNIRLLGRGITMRRFVALSSSSVAQLFIRSGIWRQHLHKVTSMLPRFRRRQAPGGSPA